MAHVRISQHMRVLDLWTVVCMFAYSWRSFVCIRVCVRVSRSLSFPVLRVIYSAAFVRHRIHTHTYTHWHWHWGVAPWALAQRVRIYPHHISQRYYQCPTVDGIRNGAQKRYTYLYCCSVQKCVKLSVRIRRSCMEFVWTTSYELEIDFLLTQ